MIKSVICKFPLTRCQAGAVGGNGLIGLLFWGEGRQLNITIGCGKIWDHRGGMDWKPEQSFDNLCNALAQNDIEKIRTMFAENRSKDVRRPSIIPVGRVELTFPEGLALNMAEMVLDFGRVDICYDGYDNGQIPFVSDMSCEHGFICKRLPEGTQIRLIPSYELCQPQPKLKYICEFDSLKARGFEEPETYDDDVTSAFLQPMPADDAFGVVLKKHDNGFACDVVLGNPDMESLKNRDLPEFYELESISNAWWHGYWAHTPEMKMDDAELEEIYWFGLYKYGIMTNPAGYPPGLQGPWIEDDHTPPWSGDYHLNINAQMYMSPGFKAGKFAHLKPMFDLVLSWRPTLRENARSFLGIENGYVLPHAVDDRGVCQGGFWTGTVDHACGAWMAMLMFDYCDYTGDEEYLRNDIYDFMVGVMRVYEAVLKRDENGRYYLPIGVSPEFGSAELGAYGRNASFQLAALHRHVANLKRASAWLGKEMEPQWLEIDEQLPQACLKDGEIALWEGLLLPESHRHHSHLGAIAPFATIDPSSPEWNEIVTKTIDRWIMMGMGQWTGWCVPWASMIQTRVHNPEAAIYLLRTWKYFFTNEGGASLHDANIRGLTIFSCLDRGEIMQIDGAMGAVTAIQDLFAYEQNGVIHVFDGIPSRWKFATIYEMALPGGFRISGNWTNGTIKLFLNATRAGSIILKVRDKEEMPIVMGAGEYRTITL